MNILFLYSSHINPSNGGVQRVTKVLADYFESKGNNIYFLSLIKPTENEYFDKRQHVLPENKKFNTTRNFHFFKEFIKEHSIDIVINQDGIGKDCSRLSNYSNKFGAIEISVLHNSLLASIINFSLTKKNKFKKNHLDFLLPLTDIKWVKVIILWLYKLKYREHFNRLCKNSDRVVLLSDKFRDEFSFFVNENNFKEKIIAIPNPCSFNLGNNPIRPKKEKILLYVGRIEFTQKRVDLLIEIWNEIYRDFDEWKLLIVGDGPDLDEAKQIATNLKTERIYFEGVQNSERYYEKASIFCMTSTFEGFPMVLVEAQTFGAIPVVFNSFASITDIIANGETGFLVEPFDKEAYINMLSILMTNKEMLQSISIKCVESVKKFSLEKIGNQWIELFHSLIKKND